MSFADKLGSLISRPSDNLSSDVSWGLKYAARVAGTISGAFAIFFGVWSCTEILFGAVRCFLGGIWQMLGGFFVLVVEAPCCCMFIDFVQALSDWVEKRPFWNRGLAYCIIALPPIFLCFNFSSLLGSGSIFLTGVLYGFMSLGKKASREDMAAMATPHQGLTSPTVGGQPDNSATHMEDLTWMMGSNNGNAE